MVNIGGASYPFTAFNFSVEIEVPGVSNRVCNAAFAECDGLEMSMEVKTIREGGQNAAQVHLAGPVSYTPLTLRRGMTASYDLWTWFTATQTNPALRADATITLLDSDGQTERARFILTRCLPVKLKAPSLNAKEGALAVEELELAYETLAFQPPASATSGVSQSQELQ
jgi:phage tail-like protein